MSDRNGMDSMDDVLRTVKRVIEDSKKKSFEPERSLHHNLFENEEGELNDISEIEIKPKDQFREFLYDIVMDWLDDNREMIFLTVKDIVMNDRHLIDKVIKDEIQQMFRKMLDQND
ncbi:hypothetical protein [Candidatus Gromoviella agglomerans]|uniref:hypothetical protein n=1 Tax=Candidatus Gromoviella agglomerans TaxID=2806609 RepID=UPI001E5B7E6F|nr:hypothetical protein [Candidatus Gromoviella agglomerans]